MKDFAIFKNYKSKIFIKLFDYNKSITFEQFSFINKQKSTIKKFILKLRMPKNKNN